MTSFTGTTIHVSVGRSLPEKNVYFPNMWQHRWFHEDYSKCMIFQSSAARIWGSLFWGVVQRRIVNFTDISGQRIGLLYEGQKHLWMDRALKKGLTVLDCFALAILTRHTTETPVSNYQPHHVTSQKSKNLVSRRFERGCVHCCKNFKRKYAKNVYL